jgi:hypothetical protein
MTTAKACCWLHTGFLLSLLVNPDDGSDIFLWSAGSLSTDHIALYPRKRTSSLFMLGMYTGMESSWFAAVSETRPHHCAHLAMQIIMVLINGIMAAYHASC